MTPNLKDFPIKFDASEHSAREALMLVADKMEVNPELIEISFFNETTQEFYAGFGNRMFTRIEEGEKTAAGKYYGKNENGKYHISLEESELKHAEGMIGTFAHEIAHIKLLGEGRIEENNEPLTDLVTVLFGLGIFNANGAFNFRTGYDGWSYQKTGYLSQMAWGYALALLTCFKKDYEPEWVKYLHINVQKDMKNSILFIRKFQTPKYIGFEEEK